MPAAGDVLISSLVFIFRFRHVGQWCDSNAAAVINTDRCVPFTKDDRMKLILLTYLLFGLVLVGFGQGTSNKNLTPEFFYGTWTDSTKTGMTLKTDGEFLMVEKNPGSGFEDPRIIEGVKWTYNLFLDKTPIVLAVFCNHCDNKPVPKKITGHIEVIDHNKLYLITLDSTGQEKKRIQLRRN
jgi:hypothetical protein